MNRDARARMYDSRLKAQKQAQKEALASAERKWEFRYDNQAERIRELEETVKKLRTKIRELKDARSV